MRKDEQTVSHCQSGAPNERRKPASCLDRGERIFRKHATTLSQAKMRDSPNTEYLRVCLVKTYEGLYYGGFVNAPELPATWPSGIGLERMFEVKSSDVCHFDEVEVPEASSLVNQILRAWSTSKNVLLYGPPGTGQTNAMHEVKYSPGVTKKPRAHCRCSVRDLTMEV